MFVMVGMMLLTVSIALASVSRAEAAGIAGPAQTIAEGLPVLLGDPAKSGTDPGDTDPGATYHWRQIILGGEPYVKLSHIDKTTTMFIAPEVSRDTLFRFGLKKNAEAEVTVDITVVNLGADSPSNTTFIDHMIGPATCDTYDPVTRACGSGTYKAQRTSFMAAWYPLPKPGWRFVFREGSYSYTKKNATTCRPAVMPVLRIEGPNAANGTPTNPIQFKVHKNGATYENVRLDMGGVTDCANTGQALISDSSYVIVEGFEMTGARAKGTSGRMVVVGGLGWSSGGINDDVAPSHHITLRNLNVHTNGALGNTHGLFSIRGPSHEIAIHGVQAYDGASGMVFGRSQGLDRNTMPYNIFVHTALLYSNKLYPPGAFGYAITGARNTSCYRCVTYDNPDGGFGTQGPHADSNVWWDSLAFRADSETSPAFTGTFGNERGVQTGTINPGFAKLPSCAFGGQVGRGCLRAGIGTRVYRSIAFDNMGNGFNDVSGNVDSRFYHLTAFNNCRRRRLPSGNALTGYAGIVTESFAGHPDWPGSPGPNATIANTASYWNGQDTGCQGGGSPVNFLIVFEPPRHPWAILNLLTNSPRMGGNPNFLVATPTPLPAAERQVRNQPESGVTVDVAIYTDSATRTLNPHFGTAAGLQLQATSPLIDKGTFVPGVHCDRADDAPNPYPANDPNCIHWKGRAPDLGTYEYGIEVHPPSTSGPPVPGAPTGLQVR